MIPTTPPSYRAPQPKYAPRVVDQTAREDRWTPAEPADAQDMQGGWRTYAVRGENRTAAQLLDRYAELPELPAGQANILYFHSGQSLASAHDYPAAIERFTKAYNQPEPSDSPLRWNAYVRGTVAFLSKDLGTLEKCRDEVAAGPSMPDGKKGNLAQLQSFCQNFDRRYQEAYADASKFS